MKIIKVSWIFGYLDVDGTASPEKVPGNQKKFPVLDYQDRGIARNYQWKIPIIKELGIFNQSRYCKDHSNQGPDNQGLAV